MRNILVIGGSSGIGAAVVDELKSNANVLASFNQNSIESKDNNVSYFHYNVNNDQLDTSTLPEVIDGFVYCPGGIKLLPFGRIKEDQLKQDFDTQVLGAIRTLQAVLPNLKKRRNASVVFFSTVAVQTEFNFHSQIAV